MATLTDPGTVDSLLAAATGRLHRQQARRGMALTERDRREMDRAIAETRGVIDGLLDRRMRGRG